MSGVETTQTTMAMENDPLLLLVKRQLLQMRPIRQFQWTLSSTTTSSSSSSSPSPSSQYSITSLEMQQSILTHIFSSSIFKLYKPSDLYLYSFLKQYISKIESDQQQGQELLDELMEYFTELMLTIPKRPEAGGPPLKPCFKSYCLDQECKDVVTVMEEQSMVSGGTTGLRTWEASFWLAEYLLENRDVIDGKNVVDIGCGVGFLGLTCSLLQANQVILTDGNQDVLRMAEQNISYNTPLCPTTTKLLNWEDFNISEIQSLHADILILSDLTYDPTNIQPLTKILKAFLNHSNPGVAAYMSSAVRTQKTFDDFFTEIERACCGTEVDDQGVIVPKRQVQIKELDIASRPHFFFFDQETVETVRLFELKIF